MAGLLSSIGTMLNKLDIKEDTKHSSMIPFVIVLGRPGAGKSEFYTQAKQLLQIERGMSCIRLDDVRDLRAMARGELNGEKYVTPTADGGFTVKDPTVFDVVLRRMCNEAKKHLAEASTRSRRALGLSATQPVDPKTLVILEFARADNINALLKNFTPDVLESSLIIYLHVSLKKSMERTGRRFKLKNRTVSQDHNVPPEVIENFYATDDRNEILKDDRFKCTYLINNDEDEIETYRDEVRSVLQRVLDGRYQDATADARKLAALTTLIAREQEEEEKMAKYKTNMLEEEEEEEEEDANEEEEDAKE